MKSKLIPLLICILTLMGCVQATPPPTIDDQIDKSLFTGVPCMVPCWHGLEVGKSTESEVISTVQKLNYIDLETMQINRISGGTEIIANCISPVKECLKFDVVNDVLMKMVVGLNYEIRVDEAIELLGDPHYLGVSAVNGEIVACEVYMIWRNSGLVLTSMVATSSEEIEKHCEGIRNTGKIPSSLLITEARLISGMELLTLLTSDGKFFDFSVTQSQ
jgi:hypothetical protein